MPASNIQRYTFSNQDRLFFDANIWFFIYGPQSQEDNYRQRIYSNAFKEIISNQGKIFIDALVLSELINRITRFYYDLWCEENQLSPSYKEFRSMDVFKSIAVDVAKSAQMILVDSTPIETGFSRLDISALLTKFSESQQDFNDLIIENICQINRLTLITDDSDFKKCEHPDINLQ